MNIFKCKDEMPPTNNSPDVVRTALTMSEHAADTAPASMKNPAMSVRSVERPRFGHGY
jgi:hypothetical protein